MLGVEIHRPQAIVLASEPKSSDVDSDVVECVAAGRGCRLVHQIDRDSFIGVDTAAVLVKRAVQRSGELQVHERKVVVVPCAMPWPTGWPFSTITSSAVLSPRIA